MGREVVLQTYESMSPHQDRQRHLDKELARGRVGLPRAGSLRCNMETRTVSRLDPKPAVTLTSHQMVRFDASQCLPEKTELLVHAISDRQRLSPRLQKDVTQGLSEAPALLQPTAVLSMLNVDLGELTHISKLPPRLLARIDRAFGVVCTIGPELEAHSSQYFEGHQYTRGYLLDRIGTLAEIGRA